ncbi:ABC transporter substrate-binding protein [Bradyrhizobium sp. Arg237L]|uniref:ABC transporter substrate-binding protein n=1 Tax=Bradyrhizobium sp. Arg237L TaxID=3003352 RepID=UPI00249E36EF|nr:ABC transporter substrate-binding protein [Bradyrhizobium sp. Arg237L]MDI4234423.1 ABC transporter substrate-binding protein [Bradyrhizobium sp. Arg237L]
MKRRTFLAGLGATVFSPAIVRAAGDTPLKFGVLTDMNGLFADNGGKGSVAAAQLAIEECGGSVLGKPIELISADHQNKPDLGGNIARQWYDQDGVDVILDVPVSSVCIAVQNFAKDRNKMFITSAGGSADLSGKLCSPNFIQWTYNTYALANVAGKALLQRGADTWFFIAADYAFGHALERDVTEVVTKGGGKSLGHAPHPINTADFSSVLLTAKSSGAKVIALANAGADTQNGIKQAEEFGLTSGGQQMIALLIDVNDIQSIGLKSAQGLLATIGFYWNMDDRTREFAKRYAAKMGKPPSMMQAGVYSSALNYIKSVQAANTKDPAAVVKDLQGRTFNDAFARNGKLRADNLMVHDMYLAEVKKASEVSDPSDVFRILATVEGEDAFPPLSSSACPMVTAQK